MCRPCARSPCSGSLLLGWLSEMPGEEPVGRPGFYRLQADRYVERCKVAYLRLDYKQ